MIEPTYRQTDFNGKELTEEEKQWLVENNWNAEPFSKSNWKSAAARDTWSDVLDEASQAKYEAEWRSVLSDETDRKAAIIHINNYNREKWLRRIGEEGLAYRDIRYSEPYNGYSHKFYPTDRHDPERITYSVIAEDEDVADQMYEAEMEMEGPERHKAVGKLLGFPDCCMEHFVSIWLGENETGEQKIDPMYEASCNTECAEAIDGNSNHVLIPEVNPYTNVMYRYFNWSYITHLPCSWDCEKSTEIGKARGRIMADAGYADGANALYNWLSKPMTWTGYKSLAHIRNDSFIGSAGTSCYWNEKKIVWGEPHAQGGSIVEE